MQGEFQIFIYWISQAHQSHVSVVDDNLINLQYLLLK